MWLPASWENGEVGFSRTSEWLHQLWQVSSQWQVSYKDKKFRFMCNREIRQSLVRRCNASLKQRIFRRVSLCQNLRVPTPFFLFSIVFPRFLEAWNRLLQTRRAFILRARSQYRTVCFSWVFSMKAQWYEPQIWKSRARCLQKVRDHSVVAPYDTSQCFIFSLLRPNSRHLFKESLHFPFFFRCQVECSWFFRH